MTPRRKIIFIIFQAFLCCLSVLSSALSALSCASANTSASAVQVQEKEQLEEKLPNPESAWTPYQHYLRKAPFTVIDFQGRQEGRSMPSWVQAYLSEESSGIEQLPQFADKYCFVQSQSSSKLELLLRWEGAFKIERSFPKIAMRRVFKRWTDDKTKAPEEIYGSYFENMIRAVQASSWEGAERRGFFWLRVRYDDEVIADLEDRAGAERSELYLLLTLAVIDKSAFQNELNAVFKRVSADKKDSRLQNQAVETMISTFWQGF